MSFRQAQGDIRKTFNNVFPATNNQQPCFPNNQQSRISDFYFCLFFAIIFSYKNSQILI
jgi:hypothetical protein